jgi:glycine oxidase
MNITVIGGGVIGLSAAWELSRGSCRVTVLDAAPEAREASWAAAGMLAPHHECDEPNALWRLGARSLDLWPRFMRDLGVAAHDLDYSDGGGLIPCAAPADEAALAAEQRFLASLGVHARWHDAATLRQTEPALARMHGALQVAGAHVDPRLLTRRLADGCKQTGVAVRYQTPVLSLDGGTAVLADGSRIEADLIVLASGAWTPALARLAGIDLLGEPVKGQLLRFDAPGALRHFVHSHHVYAVPRRDGVVIGATMVQTGFDKTQDPSAVAELAQRARELMPMLDHSEITETWTGLRPRLHGGLPLIDRVDERLIIATGHFRNGILLTPVTAVAIAALAGAQPPPCDLSAFSWASQQAGAIRR